MENGVGDNSPSEDEFRFHTVGEQLKAERERQTLSLSDLATRTRVPMRHLDAIERSDFSALPGTTYTLGFTRSYASALGLDPIKFNNDLRAELSQSGIQSYQVPTQNFEPADPSRVPSRTLAWTAAAIGVLLIAGYLLWRSSMLSDDAAVANVQAPQAVVSQKSAASPATGGIVGNATDTVVLTATGSVWVKIYDAENKPLFESEMVKGDSYSVPKDANNPMIVTGRPNALNVTVGGKAVPSLGAPERTIVDVGISAASLLARSPAPSANQNDGDTSSSVNPRRR